MDFGTIYQRLINGQITSEAEYVKLMELVVHHEALYFIPGALLALIVPRKEIK